MNDFQRYVHQLYVTDGNRLVDVVKSVMRAFNMHYRDAYPLVSTFLYERRLLRHGGGKRFCKNFGWRKKICDACKTQFQPTGRAQRFCVKCVGSDPHMVITYGITQIDFDHLLDRQGRRCICGQRIDDLPRRKVHIDHDHVTGLIRGIICSWCNSKLPVLDDEQWLENAKHYLNQPGISSRCDCVILRRLRRSNVSTQEAMVD